MSSRSNTIRFQSRAFAAALLCCLLSACVLSGISTAPYADQHAQAEARTNAWVQSLVGKSPIEQAAMAEAAWQDSSLPQLLRDRAASILSTRPGVKSSAAQQALAGAYTHASPAQRISMERLLMADLLTADDGTLRLLASSVPRTQEKTFPWSLTVWQAASRKLLADNAGALERLSVPGLFADPALLGMAAGPGTGIGSGTGPHSGRTALILPLSGPFGPIGNKVVAGAAVAKDNLAAQGVRMDVIIIDSEQPGWVNQVAVLPADCVVVGGPLRVEHYADLRAQGMGGRAVFALLAQLPNPAEEGTTVWRFFTSPQDQVDAVLNFAAGEQGVHSFGVLSPDDSYGQKMTDIFLQAAGQRGLSVATSSYPTGDMKSWTKISGDFVGAVSTERGQIPQARATFDAIFLPDSWKNMDMLISALHYHGAHKKIMLGTLLWEQSLATAKGVNPSTFALAVFPGAFNAQASGNAVLQLQTGMIQRRGTADDWTALGYDFVRFAATLGMNSPQWSAASLNSRLAAGVALDWAGAPMSWDSAGRAHRRLFLFQPSRYGMTPLDHEAFRRYRDGSGPLPNSGPSDDTVEAIGAEAVESAGSNSNSSALQNLINNIMGSNQSGASTTEPPLD